MRTPVASAGVSAISVVCAAVCGGGAELNVVRSRLAPMRTTERRLVDAAPARCCWCGCWCDEVVVVVVVVVSPLIGNSFSSTVVVVGGVGLPLERTTVLMSVRRNVPFAVAAGCSC